MRFAGRGLNIRDINQPGTLSSRVSVHFARGQRTKQFHYFEILRRVSFEAFSCLKTYVMYYTSPSAAVY
jgi:hypothetical protein